MSDLPSVFSRERTDDAAAMSVFVFWELSSFDMESCEVPFVRSLRSVGRAASVLSLRSDVVDVQSN